MAESDDLDLEGGDAPDAGGAPKKKGGGLGALLPTLLKFAAIGLGALIFIVTVSVITYNIMNKGGKSQTSINDPSSPYVGTRPVYAYYTLIGSITAKTKDVISTSVTVDMIIGYDLNDNAGQTELTSRQYELRDFVRRFFSSKYAADMAPEKEEELKREIREQLNTRFLDTARARVILFNKLDVMETF